MNPLRIVVGFAAPIALAAGCGRLSGQRPVARDVDLVSPSPPGRDAGPASDAPSSDPADGAGAEAVPQPMPPIPGDPLFTNLTISGFPASVVSVPNGATSPRPVLVVLHGSGDRPDWNCDAWRHITSALGFVLCLRGAYVQSESTKDDLRFTHRGGAYLRSHVEAALDALKQRFAGYVDVERPLLAGFSLGAREIGQIATGDPGRFPRVAQVEGGQTVWTPAAVGAFVARGGSRVLFACGSRWCLPPAKAAADRLASGGVEARVVFADVGHTTDRPLQEAIMRELAWWLDGDRRWAPYP